MKIVTRHFEVYIGTAVDMLNVTSQPLSTLTLTLKIKKIINMGLENLTLIFK